MSRRNIALTREEMAGFLRAAIEVAEEAKRHGHHPFGAVLVGPDKRILMRQGNIGTVRHAETELARRAADAYEPDYLWTCTLVTTGEPCAMCSGTLYWANIGGLIFGYTEKTLLALTGSHPSNPTLDFNARSVFAAGQKTIEVHGPFPELEPELLAPHRGFWN